MLSPSHHVELALCADDTAVIATSRQPALLVKCLETYHSDLELWLSEWRIAITLSKSTAMHFAKAGRHIPKPRPVQLVGQPIHWVDTVRYLGATLDTRLTWSTHIYQVRKKSAETLGVLGPLLNRRSDLSIRNESSSVQAALPSNDRRRLPHLEIHRSLAYQETAGASVQMSSNSYQCTLVHW